MLPCVMRTTGRAITAHFQMLGPRHSLVRIDGEGAATQVEPSHLGTRHRCALLDTLGATPAHSHRDRCGALWAKDADRPQDGLPLSAGVYHERDDVGWLQVPGGRGNRHLDAVKTWCNICPPFGLARRGIEQLEGSAACSRAEKVHLQRRDTKGRPGWTV